MYDGGRGVTKDPFKAVELYAAASAQGHAKAHFALGSTHRPTFAC